MPRIPGSPDDKLALLSGINESTLPCLVADILSLQYRHTDIKIVDGPGDGRRDIFSKAPDGFVHLTQCKYHKSSGATVSSRETDEIIIALNKFNTKKGLFATTGTLSPQAKREYIDNFPDFDLNYMEGSDLVDIVLSSPVLSAVWLNGEQITSVRHAFAIPLLIRRMEQDRPVEWKGETQLHTDANLEIALSTHLTSVSSFAPYRPPKVKTYYEHAEFLIYCPHTICRGTIYLHEISDLISKVVSLTSDAVRLKNATLIMRVGKPFYASLYDEHLVNKVILDNFEPTSYVIPPSGSISTEQDWILPHNKDWLASNESSDSTCWYSAKLDCCFMVEISWPSAIGLGFYSSYQQQEARQECLRNSLYVVASTEEVDKIENACATTLSPNWRCTYGVGSVMLAWLHPYLTGEAGIGGIWDEEQGAYQWMSSPESITFLEQLRQVRRELEIIGINEIVWERAMHIAAAADKDLLQQYQSAKFCTADLIFTYELLPSPANLLGRRCLFVTMWMIPCSAQQARNVLSERLPIFASELKIYWNIHEGNGKVCFAMFSLIFICSVNQSTDQLLSETENALPKHISTLQEFLNAQWPGVELCTGIFWAKRFGIEFKDSRELS